MQQHPTSHKSTSTWDEREQRAPRQPSVADEIGWDVVVANSSSSDDHNVQEIRGGSEYCSWPAGGKDGDQYYCMAEEEKGTGRTSALSVFRANEEEILRRKTEVREKVFARLGRAEQETKRLAEIRQELEVMPDPTRKEVAAVRRKIDAINRELRPLGQSCVKKEKEYKESLEALNEKNKEKALLVSKLLELISESERLRMKMLEDLSRMVDGTTTLR